MKKSTTLFKTMLMVAVIFVMAQGCLPTGGGGSTPTNTFNVNLQTSILRQEADTSIIVDGDTLGFRISLMGLMSSNRSLLITTTSSNFEILNVQKHFYNNITHAYEVNGSLSDVNTLNAGVVIDNNYNAHPWQPFALNPFSTTNSYLNFATLSQTSNNGAWITAGLQNNTDEYVVLRKLTGNQYQYYWVKVRKEEALPNTGVYIYKVLNGKYQLNTITTGQ